MPFTRIMKKWEDLTKEEQDYWNEGAKEIPRTPIIEYMLVLVNLAKILKCVSHGYTKIIDISEEKKTVTANGRWMAHLVQTHGLSRISLGLE